MSNFVVYIVYSADDKILKIGSEREDGSGNACAVVRCFMRRNPGSHKKFLPTPVPLINPAQAKSWAYYWHARLELGKTDNELKRFFTVQKKRAAGQVIFRTRRAKGTRVRRVKATFVDSIEPRSLDSHD